MILTKEQIINRTYQLDSDNVYEARLAPAIEMIREFLITGDRSSTPDINKLVRDAYETSLSHMPDKASAYHVLHYLCKAPKHNCSYDKTVADEVDRVREVNDTDIIQLAYEYHAARIIDGLISDSEGGQYYL